MPAIHDIAVVTPMWLDYSSQLTEGARAYAREQRDLRVVVLPLQRYGESPMPRKPGSFAGLLVLANEADHWVEDLWREGLPVVNCSGDLPGAQIPSVTPHAVFGTAVDYLAGLGRRDLALICPDLDENPGYQPLCGSFRNSVSDCGLTPHVFAECRVDPGDSPSRLFEAEQEEELADFLEQLPKPAGVWCVHDELAALVCEVARIRKLAVPQSLAVLGVGNTRVARFADTPISSIPLPGPAVGYEGMKILHAQVRGEELSPEQRVVRVSVPPIVERASTRLSGDDKALHEARDMILSRACDGLTINEVVTRMPMCRMTLHTRYKAAFGCTPGEELRRVRLDAAKRLLTESDMNITGVGHACGFDEPNKFYVFFKRETGCSPSEWRRDQGKKS